MRKLLLTGFLAIAVIAGAIAQKAGYDPVNAPFGHGEDSVNCRVNLSLMQTAAKAEAYESALIPWSSVYENCPAASKNTFIYGPRIFKALYEKETDAAKKKEYLDKTLEIYDKRITYFGKDDPKETIIAYKTYDYMELMGDQADQKQIYEWLNESVKNTTAPAAEWVAGGVPITMMLNLERRHGEMKPVIQKALVKLDGAPFLYYKEKREEWAIHTDYVYPGPIQYFGPTEVCDQPSKTLQLEQTGKITF
jgi:hypothetical protein